MYKSQTWGEYRREKRIEKAAQIAAEIFVPLLMVGVLVLTVIASVKA